MHGRRLDLQQLRFLRLLELFEVVDAAVRLLLDLVFRALLFVLADLAVFLEGAEVLDAFAADVPDRYFTLLNALVDELDQVAARLFRQLRHGEPDHVAVARRVEAEVRLENGSLDGGDDLLIPWRDDEQARLGCRDGGYLSDRQ